MKKTLVILALLPLLFFSCKKGGSTDEPKPEEQKFKVNFNAKLMGIDVSPMGLKSSTSKSTNNIYLTDESVDVIEYFVYDNSENLVAHKVAKLFDNSGVFDESSLVYNIELPNGEYKVCVLGKSSLVNTVNESLGSDKISLMSIGTKYADRDIINFTAIYGFKPTKFTVSNTATSNELILKRLSAQIELIIKDAIPENAKFLFFGGTLSNFVVPFNSPRNLPGKAFIKFDLDSVRNNTDKVLRSSFIPEHLSTSEPFYLKSYDILIYDKENKYLGTKTIENVYFKENYKTKLFGDFFDTLTENNKSNIFNIEFDHTYIGEIVKDISK